MRVRLQVFKTERRGWGIRTLNDIPAGGFICIYVGNLYSNDQANRLGTILCTAMSKYRDQIQRLLQFEKR